MATAQVITHVVLYCWGRIARKRVTNAHHGDAVLVIYDMKNVIFLDYATMIAAMVFEDAVHIHRYVDLPPLPPHQLLHPLPSGIIEVLGVYRWLTVSDLCAIDAHPISVVPVKMPLSVF